MRCILLMRIVSLFLYFESKRAKFGEEANLLDSRRDRGRSFHLPAGFQESFQLRLDLERV